MPTEKIPEVEFGHVIITRLRKEPESGFGSRFRGYPSSILEVWNTDGQLIAVSADYLKFIERYWMDEYDKVQAELIKARTALRKPQKRKKKNE